MDARSAAHVLTQIAAYLELRGESKFKVRAYETAARRLLALGSDDLAPMLRSGELARVPGVGPATLAVVRDLVDHGESRYLEELRAEMPEGLLDLLRVPGLAIEKIRTLHAALGIASLEELELAAREGRLASVKGFGRKTSDKILAGIEFLKRSGVLAILAHATRQGEALLAAVRSDPRVTDAAIAGSLRRMREVVADVDIVAACAEAPVDVARSFTRIAGVRGADGGGASVSVRFVDGTKLDLHCVRPEHFAVALWRATGTREHVAAVAERLAARGITVDGDVLRDGRGSPVPCADEGALYELAGMSFVPPELREDGTEVAVAATHALPRLVEPADIRGVLHCHSTYSDGGADIAAMAAAARAKGWSYLGVSDHSQAAFYASGVSRERMLDQHDEIDALNATLTGFRVLKGVEADILADGRLDYDAALLDRFDYVIASIHSRFRMDGPAMTERVLRAMDDPHMTVLAHPTGRLLLSREPYALDVDAVLEKAAAVGVAIEVNADPRRLDLDWRYLRRAMELGVTIEIGPDAHSTSGLDWTDLGVSMARKGWVTPARVLNARDADGVLAFARARRA